MKRKEGYGTHRKKQPPLIGVLLLIYMIEPISIRLYFSLTFTLAAQTPLLIIDKNECAHPHHESEKRP